MRKGFSLIEMLIVIMTVPIIAVTVDRVFRELLVDIPRGVHLVAQHGRLLGVVEAIHDDIDQATSLALEDPTRIEGPPVLLIEQPERQVRYAIVGDVIRRECRGGNMDPNDSAELEWRLPKAKMTWRLWRRGDTVVGLLLDTSVDHGGREKPKFQNTHLFLTGVPRAQGERHATP